MFTLYRVFRRKEYSLYTRTRTCGRAFTNDAFFPNADRYYIVRYVYILTKAGFLPYCYFFRNNININDLKREKSPLEESTVVWYGCNEKSVL
jgi:hypothetical protein